MKLRSLACLVALSSLSVLTSCQSLKKKAAEPEKTEETKDKEKKSSSLYDWDDAKIDAASGPLRMVISVDNQKATLFRGDRAVAWTTVATGVTRYPTPAGNFSIMEKVPDKKSNLYGKIYSGAGKCVNSDARNGRDSIPAGGKFVGARLRYWMRLTGDGVGMHVGPIPRPGQRASHGCIRLPSAVAGKMYARLPVGTPVKVTDSNPAPRRKISSSSSKPKSKPAATSNIPVNPSPEVKPNDGPYTPPTLPATETKPDSPAPSPAAPTTPAPAEAAPAAPSPAPATPEIKTPVEPAAVPAAVEGDKKP